MLPVWQLCQNPRHIGCPRADMSRTHTRTRTVSNDTRVRMEGLVKIMARLLPAQGQGTDGVQGRHRISQGFAGPWQQATCEAAQVVASPRATRHTRTGKGFEALVVRLQPCLHLGRRVQHGHCSGQGDTPRSSGQECRSGVAGVRAGRNSGCSSCGQAAVLRSCSLEKSSMCCSSGGKGSAREGG